MPKWRRVGSEKPKCRDRIVLRSDKNHVQGDIPNLQLGHVERLRVDLAVNRERNQLSKLRRIHVAVGKNGLVGVSASPRQVIVVGGDRDLGSGKWSEKQHSRSGERQKRMEPGGFHGPTPALSSNSDSIFVHPER